jgi:hypothetical protein
MNADYSIGLTTQREATTMQFDPLTKYCTLIPGGLHYIPGGLNLPREKRMRNASSQPDCSPGADGTARLAKIFDRFTIRIRKSLTVFRKSTVGRKGDSRLPAFWRPRSSRSGIS